MRLAASLSGFALVASGLFASPTNGVSTSSIDTPSSGALLADPPRVAPPRVNWDETERELEEYLCVILWCAGGAQTIDPAAESLAKQWVLSYQLNGVRTGLTSTEIEDAVTAIGTMSLGVQDDATHLSDATRLDLLMTLSSIDGELQSMRSLAKVP